MVTLEHEFPSQDEADLNDNATSKDEVDMEDKPSLGEVTLRLRLNHMTILPHKAWLPNKTRSFHRLRLPH